MCKDISASREPKLIPPGRHRKPGGKILKMLLLVDSMIKNFCHLKDLPYRNMAAMDHDLCFPTPYISASADVKRKMFHIFFHCAWNKLPNEACRVDRWPLLLLVEYLDIFHHLMSNFNIINEFFATSLASGSPFREQKEKKHVRNENYL